MDSSEQTQRFTPEFGRVGQRLAINEQAWHDTIQVIVDDAAEEGLFDIGDMCRYVSSYSDAEIVGYILASRDDEVTVLQHAAYRGMVFGHFILESLTGYSAQLSLEDYWHTYGYYPKSLIQHRLVHEMSEYMAQSESFDRLLGRFMPELCPRDGSEYVVEVGAALILRQAEYKEAVDDEVRAFSDSLVDL